MDAGGQNVPIGRTMVQQLRAHLREGHSQTTHSFNQMRELGQITSDELGRLGFETKNLTGSHDQMQEAWTMITQTIATRDDYQSETNIADKMELFNKIYQAAVSEYSYKLSQETRGDLSGPMAQEEGLIGGLFGTRFEGRIAPRDPAAYYG